MNGCVRWHAGGLLDPFGTNTLTLGLGGVLQMSIVHDAEVDLVVLGSRGKALVVSRTHDGFSVIVLDRAEYEALAAERLQFTGKTISAATQRARQAVESEG